MTPLQRYAATLGIMVVPRDPDPDAFPPMPHACTIRPMRCHLCAVACFFGKQYARLQDPELKAAFRRAGRRI